MSGLFALHLEDASGEGTRLTDAEVGGLDESETATAEIAELRQEEAEIVEAEVADVTPAETFGNATFAYLSSPYVQRTIQRF